MPYAEVSFGGSDVKVVWASSVGRPDASGTIDQSAYPMTGQVNFRDDRIYLFWFYPDTGVLYWDADQNNDNKWASNDVSCDIV